MSANGHLQTWPAQDGMSASPLKAGYVGEANAFVIGLHGRSFVLATIAFFKICEPPLQSFLQARRNRTLPGTSHPHTPAMELTMYQPLVRRIFTTALSLACLSFVLAGQADAAARRPTARTVSAMQNNGAFWNPQYG